MSPRRLSVVLTWCVAAMLLPAGTALGQGRALQQRLAAATSLQCTFSVLVTGTWTDGVPVAEVSAHTLTVAFRDVDADEGTAEAEGTFGGTGVVVRFTNDYLHLMQTQSSGALYTTTVLARETTGGRLMAVHTRHEFTDVRLPGYTSRPEMYLGDCAVGS